MSEKVQIGNATLYCGDCMDEFYSLPMFDLLCTDPPYGLGGKLHRPSKPSANSWSRHFSDGAPSWDVVTAPEAVAAAIEKARQSIVWGGQFYELGPGRCILTWNKIFRNWTSSEAEHAWSNLDKPNRVFDYSLGQLATEGKHYHITQKPLPLMAWCISHADNMRDCFDPFMGSGTTGVACVQMGIAFTGVERERKYFDIACERISRAQAQGQLIPFEAPAAAEQIGMDLCP